MHKVLVKFADSSKNYVTSINAKCTPEEICEYFLGKPLNLGTVTDDVHICIGIQINDDGDLIYDLNRFIVTLENGDTFLMETAKTYQDICYTHMYKNYTNKRTGVTSRVVKLAYA